MIDEQGNHIVEIPMYEQLSVEQFVELVKKMRELDPGIVTVAAGQFTVHFAPKPDQAMPEAIKTAAMTLARMKNGGLGAV